MSKKKSSVSLSTAEAEYIAATSCCAQLLWMKKLLHDYGITQDTICVFCDNTSAINLSKDPIQHLKSKHIEIWYHSFEIWRRKKLCIWSSSPLTTRRQTYLLNLLMARSLRPCVRPSMSISFLELYLVCEPILFIIKHLVFRFHMLWISFYKFCFVLVLVDLTLFVLFLSVFKNSKPIKIEKSSKSLIVCFVYFTCKFGLVPSY